MPWRSACAIPTLGQAVVVVSLPRLMGEAADSEALLLQCRQRLPTFMVPLHVEWRDTLPRNPNGKFDRPRLASELQAALCRSGQ